MNIDGLIVSCQAGAGHPLRDTATIVRLARAAESGGAEAIRCGESVRSRTSRPRCGSARPVSSSAPRSPIRRSSPPGSPRSCQDKVGWPQASSADPADRNTSSRNVIPPATETSTARDIPTDTRPTATGFPSTETWNRAT